METANISALLEPFIARTLSSAQLDQISIYIDLLLRWNARINLTSVRAPEEIVTRHFGESLFLASHVFSDSSDHRLLPTARCLDIGSGAGFPALPLKIWAPSIHLTMIESNHKKAAFLREVARSLTLTNVNVLTARAETLAATQDRPRADLVTLRAVEHFKAILPQAVAFLAPHATLALLVGKSQLPRLATQTAITWQVPIHIPKSESRVLSVGHI